MNGVKKVAELVFATDNTDSHRLQEFSVKKSVAKN